MKLYLLRHGETDWNTQWKLQGRSDIPLNEKGMLQAREAAVRYKDYPFDAVYSSPLQRAMKTAEIIAEPHGLQVVPDDRLVEMCFGLLEGQTVHDSSLHQELAEARSNLFDAPWKYEPLGDGETFDQLDSRCRNFVEFLKDNHPEYGHVLISAHGALCKGLLRAINGTPVSQFWETPPQPNCSVIEIDV